MEEHEEQIQIFREKSKTSQSNYLNISQTTTQNQKPRVDLDSLDFSLYPRIFSEFLEEEDGGSLSPLGFVIRVLMTLLMSFYRLKSEMGLDFSLNGPS